MSDSEHQTTITPSSNGPYIVKNLGQLHNSRGESLATRPTVALRT